MSAVVRFLRKPRRWWQWVRLWLVLSPAALGLIWLTMMVLVRTGWDHAGVLLVGSLLVGAWFGITLWRRGAERAEVEGAGMRAARAAAGAFAGLFAGPILLFMVAGTVFLIAGPAIGVMLLIQRLAS